MFLEPEKLQHHSNEGKRTEKKKGRGVGKEEKREREREKKNNGCTPRFYNGYFGRKKNC